MASKTRPVTVRLTPLEVQELKELADARGMTSVGSLIRSMIPPDGFARELARIKHVMDVIVAEWARMRQPPQGA